MRCVGTCIALGRAIAHAKRSTSAALRQRVHSKGAGREQHAKERKNDVKTQRPKNGNETQPSAVQSGTTLACADIPMGIDLSSALAVFCERRADT